MKHSGRARQAALKMIFWTLVGLLLLFVAGFLASVLGAVIAAIAFSLVGLWVIFAVFTLYFFRDPTPRVPIAPNLVVSPGHGKVDVIDETMEPNFMGGPCKRVSIFLSVFNVHVQNAPVSGRIAHFKYSEGKFLNALKTESAAQNENVLIGFDSSERPGDRIGVRLIAGLIARRIVPYIELGDNLQRGERISLIQFGSRVDVYLPQSAQIVAKLGDHVVGGETVIATLE